MARAFLCVATARFLNVVRRQEVDSMLRKNKILNVHPVQLPLGSLADSPQLAQRSILLPLRLPCNMSVEQHKSQKHRVASCYAGLLR